MFRLALLVVGIVTLVGCSTTPPVTVENPSSLDQYCNTKENIIVQDGTTVSSRTEVYCSDNKADKVFEAQAGLGHKCGESTRQMMLGGKLAEYKIISCQRPDGSWYIAK